MPFMSHVPQQPGSGQYYIGCPARNYGIPLEKETNGKMEECQGEKGMKIAIFQKSLFRRPEIRTAPAKAAFSPLRSKHGGPGLSPKAP